MLLGFLQTGLFLEEKISTNQEIKFPSFPPVFIIGLNNYMKEYKTMTSEGYTSELCCAPSQTLVSVSKGFPDDRDPLHVSSRCSDVSVPVQSI